MTTVVHPPHKGYRTSRVPLAESASDHFLTDRSYAKDRLEDLYEEQAALFPEAFPWGYAFCGQTAPAMQQQRLCRRRRLEQGRTVCTIAPACVMPSMTGRTHDVDQALFVRRFHVPCWALAPGCGREAMSWYRLEQGLGRFSRVGTTVKRPAHFPKALGADEKPSGLQGAPGYSAPTAAPDCLLGASVAPSASQGDWEKAYGVWASEAQVVDADYAPPTVTTDGGQATQGAGKALCTQITVIVCFLQAFLNIRDRATKPLGDAFAQVHKRVWEAYHAPSQGAFSQRLRRLRAWAETALPDGAMQSHPLDVCSKRDPCRKSYNYPEAHRTSPMGDRLMKFLDRAFFNAPYFHGMPASAESRVRA